MSHQAMSPAGQDGATKSSQIDYKAIAAAALVEAKSIVEHLAPGGKYKASEYTALNPTRNDSSQGSFCININSGVWSEFATGDAGSDLISLWAYIRSIKQSVAAKQLAEFLHLPNLAGYPVTVATGVRKPIAGKALKPVETVVTLVEKAVPPVTRNGWQALSSVPPGAPPPPAVHPELGKPTTTYPYPNADSTLASYNYRFDLGDGKKEFRPVAYFQHAISGDCRWQFGAPASPRPLYNAPELQAKCVGTVILVEGEKTAEAAKKLFPSFVITTWSGGANAIEKSDFSILKGRKVLIWPDNDQPGINAMNRVCHMLKNLGADVRFVRKESFFPVDADPVTLKSFDAADAVSAGWTAEKVLALKDKGLLLEPEWVAAKAESAEPAASNTHYFGPFTVDDKGVSYQPPPDESGDNPKPIWICSRLDITAGVRNTDNESWSRLLEFKDLDGRHHMWCMPMELLAGDGSEYRRVLLNMGLQISPGRKARDLLATYLQSVRPAVKARCAARTGWHLTEDETND
jgi:putative DNA primase/helicase